MSKIVTGKNDIHQDTGVPLSQFYNGPTAQWQTFPNAVKTLPSLQHYQGIQNLRFIVQIPEAKENGKGNFRDSRWDFAASNFVDAVTGQIYGEADVVGWTVGAFPF